MNTENNEMLVPLEQAKNVCRICLLSNQNSQYIFNGNQSDTENRSSLSLLQKLVFYGGVEVLKDDGLPNSICLPCISRINAAHELRIQCQEADERLRRAYGKPLINYRVLTHAFQKDQYSQTESIDESNIIKSESKISRVNESRKTDFLKKNENNFQNVDNDTTDVEYHDLVKYEESSNVLTEQSKLIEKSQFSQKRENLKTRRASVFKRVTSIENLRNHKERQRQYIKKSMNVKSDINDRDTSIKRNVLVTEYKCSTCNRFFTNEKSLRRHEAMHANKLKCSFCEKQFFKQEKLLNHEKLHESKSEPVHCKICEKSFRKTDTMVRHLNVHKKANPKEVFNILKEMRDKRKIANETEECDKFVVNEIFQQEEMLRVNFSGDKHNSVLLNVENEYANLDNVDSNKITEELTPSSNNPLYRCKHCIKCYSSEKAFQRHLLIHEEKKFSCTVCNMKFVRHDRLESHRKRYGHGEDKGWNTEPDKPPDDKSALKLINTWIREELDSDNEGKGFPCEICGKSYVTKKSLLKHRANAHEIQDDNYSGSYDKDCTKAEKSKPYTCSECGKSFEKDNKLQKHKRIHERSKEQQDANFKRFLCHICSKTFRQNTGLMFHMRTHTGYKPHVCKYCGRGFTSNSNCINHERTHTGDRPFVCHFCSAAFAKSCTLKAHITTHTGEANYHCKTCGKSFRRLKYLKEHRFTHTGEKPYACKLCGTAYSHSGSLFVHEKKCKAHYNSNYQAIVTQTTPVYCQSQNTIGVSSMTTSAVPSSQQIMGNDPLNKNYVVNVQKNGAQACLAGNPGLLSMHTPSEVTDIASTVRNFAIIEQAFRS